MLTRYQSIHRTVLRLEQALDKDMGCVRSIILERSSRDLGIVLVAMESVPVFTPFSRRYTPKIRKMKTLLLSHLDKVFVEAVVPSNLFDTDKHDLDVNLLSPILRSYVTMEEEVHLCDLYSSRVVAPFLAETLTKSKLDGGARNSCNGLEAVFAAILQFIAAKCSLLLETAQNTAPSLNLLMDG